MRVAPAETQWDERVRHDHEDYHTFGEPAPPWDVLEEEWQHRERMERHHDFTLTLPCVPARESDDWRMAA